MRSAAAAVLVAAALAASGPALGTVQPRLRVSLPPFVVRGAGFHAQERVTVTVLWNGRHSRIVRASAAGAFSAAFPGVVVDRCGGYFVRAVGDAGSRAVLRIMPACAPIDTTTG